MTKRTPPAELFENDYHRVDMAAIDKKYSPEYLAWRKSLARNSKGKEFPMARKNAMSFADALKAGKKPAAAPKRPADGSRFVETGEGLKIECASDGAAKAAEPVAKMVPMEDILLDILEEEEDREEAEKAAKSATEGKT